MVVEEGTYRQQLPELRARLAAAGLRGAFEDRLPPELNAALQASELLQAACQGWPCVGRPFAIVRQAGPVASALVWCQAGRVHLRLGTPPGGQPMYGFARLPPE